MLACPARPVEASSCVLVSIAGDIGRLSVHPVVPVLYWRMRRCIKHVPSLCACVYFVGAVLREGMRVPIPVGEPAWEKGQACVGRGSSGKQERKRADLALEWTRPK